MLVSDLLFIGYSYLPVDDVHYLSLYFCLFMRWACHCHTDADARPENVQTAF